MLICVGPMRESTVVARHGGGLEWSADAEEVN